MFAFPSGAAVLMTLYTSIMEPPMKELPVLCLLSG
jgi:hypothetical protein